MLAFFLHDDLHQLVALVVGQLHLAARLVVHAARAVAPAVVAVVDLGAFTARVFAVLVVGDAVACPLLGSVQVLLAWCLFALQGVVVAVRHLRLADGACLVLRALLRPEPVCLVVLSSDGFAYRGCCAGSRDRQAVACWVKLPALHAGVRAV